MGFLNKIARFFKASELTPASPSATAGAAPVAGPTPMAPAAASRTAPTESPTVAAPDPSASLRDQFLAELRSIPIRRSAADDGRQDVLNELRRLQGKAS
jgi:hypothetical protein